MFFCKIFCSLSSSESKFNLVFILSDYHQSETWAKPMITNIPWWNFTVDEESSFTGSLANSQSRWCNLSRFCVLTIYWYIDISQYLFFLSSPAFLPVLRELAEVKAVDDRGEGSDCENCFFCENCEESSSSQKDASSRQYRRELTKRDPIWTTKWHSHLIFLCAENKGNGKGNNSKIEL